VFRVERAVGGWNETGSLAFRETEDDVDVGSSQKVREETLLLHERSDDRGIDAVRLEIDDRSTDLEGGGAGEPIDIRRDDAGPRAQLGLLLAREVVVEAVYDEDRNEDEGERDDPNEAERQARLERPRCQLPQDSWQPTPPTRPTGVSARRTRSRPLGPS
jgi:hypothetical protein